MLPLRFPCYLLKKSLVVKDPSLLVVGNYLLFVARIACYKNHFSRVMKITHWKYCLFKANKVSWNFRFSLFFFSLFSEVEKLKVFPSQNCMSKSIVNRTLFNTAIYKQVKLRVKKMSETLSNLLRSSRLVSVGNYWWYFFSSQPMKSLYLLKQKTLQQFITLIHKNKQNCNVITL